MKGGVIIFGNSMGFGQPTAPGVECIPISSLLWKRSYALLCLLCCPEPLTRLNCLMLVCVELSKFRLHWMAGFNRSDEVVIWFQIHIVIFYAWLDLLPVQWSRALCRSLLFSAFFFSLFFLFLLSFFSAFFFPLFFLFLLSLGITEFNETFRLGPQVSVRVKHPAVSASPLLWCEVGCLMPVGSII